MQCCTGEGVSKLTHIPVSGPQAVLNVESQKTKCKIMS